jgi:predicted acyl esterase
MDDGYDTLSWVASQLWSNGRVGTYGCSSLGITQVQLAQKCHPAHVCAIAQGSGGANGSAGNRHRLWDLKLGGAAEIGYYVPWFYESGTKDHSQPEPKTTEEYAHALAALPVIDALKKIDSPPTDFENWLSRHPADPWFDRIGFLSENAKVHTPTLFVNSWYDVGAADTLHQRQVFRSGAKTDQARHHQHIILSAAAH